MKHLQEIILGRDGIEYVRRRLRKGTGLCSSVLNMSYSGGVAFAPLPEGTSLERAKVFNTGGITSRPRAAEWFVGHIHSIYKNTIGVSLIFQDVWSSSDFRVIKTSDDKKFMNNTNAYYFLEKNEINLRLIDRLIGAVSRGLFIAFFSRFRIHKSEFSIDNIVSDEVINILAYYVQEIFVGAYDQEGLVIWRR